MSDPTYEELKTPITRDEIVATMLSVLEAADLPVASWGPTDEPYATIAADAEVLTDLSLTITNIARMGVTDDAEGDALKIHAKDVFDVDKALAVATRGTVRATETAATPHTWLASELVFCARYDTTLTFRNVADVSLSASSTLTFEVYCEQTGTVGNIQAADLTVVTAVPGVAFVPEGSGTSWIGVSGTDDELDASLRARCKLKWSTLTTTGPTDAYTKWALDASASVNRVRISEDLTAVYPDPAVTVVVAGSSGSVGSTVLDAVEAYIETRRPLGTLVAYASATDVEYVLGGNVSVKAGYLATSATKINTLLASWFGGNDISINGETLPGLEIGGVVTVAQVVELVMSAPGVTAFIPIKSDNTVFILGTDDLALADAEVAYLTNVLVFVPV